MEGDEVRKVLVSWSFFQMQLDCPAVWIEGTPLMVAPHNPCGPVATAVTLHFSASTPNFFILEIPPR